MNTIRQSDKITIVDSPSLTITLWTNPRKKDNNQRQIHNITVASNSFIYKIDATLSYAQDDIVIKEGLTGIRLQCIHRISQILVVFTKPIVENMIKVEKQHKN